MHPKKAFQQILAIAADGEEYQRQAAQATLRGIPTTMAAGTHPFGDLFKQKKMKN